MRFNPLSVLIIALIERPEASPLQPIRPDQQHIRSAKELYHADIEYTLDAGSRPRPLLRRDPLPTSQSSSGHPTSPMSSRSLGTANTLSASGRVPSSTGTYFPIFSRSSVATRASLSSPSGIAASANASKPWYIEHKCVAYSDPDFRGNSVCQCDDGFVYPQNHIGTMPASEFPGVCYATAQPTQTTVKNASPCNVFGPSDCPAATQPPYGQIIGDAMARAEAAYNASILGNCTDFQYHYGYPGPEAEANNDNCGRAFPIGEHMKWWWKENQALCGEHYVGFANCFYDRVPQPAYEASNCSDLGANWYCREPDARDFKGVNASLDFYVAYNIYNFAIWANSYWNGLYRSAFLAGQQAWNTSISFVKPEKGIPKWAKILLYTLTLAFGLISPSGWGRAIGKNTPGKESTEITHWLTQTVQTLGQRPWEYVLRAVQQAPAYIEHMSPSGTESELSAIMTSADIEARLAEYIQLIADVMRDVALNIPGNATAFDEWTRSGYFFSEPEDQGSMTNTIKAGLNTFVISQMLEADNFVIARQVDTNPHDFMWNNTQFVAKGYIDCDTYDKWNICNQWWYYPPTNTAYSLYQKGHSDQSFVSNVRDLFEGGLSTPDVLFLGSQLCAIGAVGTDPTGDPGLTFDYTLGSIGTKCLANVGICTWNLEKEWPIFYEKECKGDPILPDCKADEPDPPKGYLGFDLYNGIADKCSA